MVFIHSSAEYHPLTEPAVGGNETGDLRDDPDEHPGRLFGAETMNEASYWIRRSARPPESP